MLNATQEVATSPVTRTPRNLKESLRVPKKKKAKEKDAAEPAKKLSAERKEEMLIPKELKNVNSDMDTACNPDTVSIHESQMDDEPKSRMDIRKEEPKRLTAVASLPSVTPTLPALPPPTTAATAASPNTKSKSTTKSTIEVTEDEKLLLKLPYYHGFLPREDLSVLSHEGDFLVRMSEVEDPKRAGQVKREIILSVLLPGKEGRIQQRNVIVKKSRKQFFAESHVFFDSVSLLVEHYKQHVGQVNKSLKLHLKSPVLHQNWEFMHGDVQLGDVLGAGAFGEVRLGKLKLKDGKVTPIALKVMKGEAVLNKQKIKELMAEARIVRNLNHDNVIRTYGVAVDEQPLYILIELAESGALDSYLKKTSKISHTTKALMSLDAARGVAYLHENVIIHRDLAARNCLLGKDLVVKISDFGMSRAVLKYRMRTSCRLPIRWLSPETMSNFCFSDKSDVYSFGVLMYEIYADGMEPWLGVRTPEVKSHVMGGDHVVYPDDTPPAILRFVHERVLCKEPVQRANMKEVASFLEVASRGTVKSKMGGGGGGKKVRKH